jgi:hypothetical protein
MRIPTNSTFSKEIAKQFKRIFHKDIQPRYDSWWITRFTGTN